MIKDLIQKLMQHQNLSSKETSSALTAILSGCPIEQAVAFLVLLHSKGETAEELFGLIVTMQEKMKMINLDGPVLDIVGTGGDSANTVNISTASSLLAAACDVNVVKHGNRSVSSRCGSADLLEAFGVHLDKTPEAIQSDLRKKHFAFCFAPSFNPAMKAIKAIRNALGVPTSFNLMGPLTNPAKPEYMLVGVYKPDYLNLFADTLIKLGVHRAMVVHSCGLDELSLLGPADVIEVHHRNKKAYSLDPKDFGFQYSELSAIQGRGPEENKNLIQAALTGTPGAIADTIVLNTAAALYVAERVASIEAGVSLALEKIKTGLALKGVE